MNTTRKLKTKLILISCLILLLIVSLGLFQSWRQNSEVNQEIDSLQTNIKNLEKDNLELKELVEYFNSDAYIEEKARIDLGLKKPEEKVVVVSNQREQGVGSIQEQISKLETKNLSNPQKWLKYFFN